MEERVDKVLTAILAVCFFLLLIAFVGYVYNLIEGAFYSKEPLFDVGFEVSPPPCCSGRGVFE